MRSAEKELKAFHCSYNSSIMDDHWIRAYSHTRGQYYYFNKQTGESRWELPQLSLPAWLSDHCLMHNIRRSGLCQYPCGMTQATYMVPRWSPYYRYMYVPYQYQTSTPKSTARGTRQNKVAPSAVQKQVLDRETRRRRSPGSSEQVNCNTSKKGKDRTTSAGRAIPSKGMEGKCPMKRSERFVGSTILDSLQCGRAAEQFSKRCSEEVKKQMGKRLRSGKTLPEMDKGKDKGSESVGSKRHEGSGKSAEIKNNGRKDDSQCSHGSRVTKGGTKTPCSKKPSGVSSQQMQGSKTSKCITKLSSTKRREIAERTLRRLQGKPSKVTKDSKVSLGDVMKSSPSSEWKIPNIPSDVCLIPLQTTEAPLKTNEAKDSHLRTRKRAKTEEVRAVVLKGEPPSKKKPQTEVSQESVASKDFGDDGVPVVQGCVRKNSVLEMEVDQPTEKLGGNKQETWQGLLPTPLDSPAGTGRASMQESRTRAAKEDESEMEVDIPSDTEGKVLVIVDTNVLIHDLAFVQDIKGKDIEGLGEVILVIPWLVIRELDGLKGGNNNCTYTPLSTSARKALSFLHKYRGDPHVKGQSFGHYLKTIKTAGLETNDDKILRFCLGCQKKYDRNQVVLLSNDKNLCVKASFSGIPSSERNNFIKDIKEQVKTISELNFSSDKELSLPLPGHSTTPSQSVEWNTPEKKDAVSPAQVDPLSAVVVDEMNAKVSSSTSPSSTTPRATGSKVKKNTKRGSSSSSLSSSSSASSPSLKPSTPDINFNDKRKCLKESVKNTPSSSKVTASPSVRSSSDLGGDVMERVQELTKKMLSILKLAFVVILRQEMVECYTDHWLEIVHKKPPWTLLDALQCIKKHYIAVFSLLLGRWKEKEVVQLMSLVSKVGTDGWFTPKEAESFRFSAMALLIQLEKHEKFKVVCTTCMQDLENAYNTWKKFISSKHTSSIESPPSDSKPVATRLRSRSSEEMVVSPNTPSPNTSPTSPGMQWAPQGKAGVRKELEFAAPDAGGPEMRGAGSSEGGREALDDDHVSFAVLTVFESIWTLLQHHRAVILSSFQNFSTVHPAEGVPTKQESLNHLSGLIPLVQTIIDALQRLLSSPNSAQLVLCADVAESMQTFIKTLKMNAAANCLQAEVLQQFVSRQENRERLVVGSQQLMLLQQQLMECMTALVQ